MPIPALVVAGGEMLVSIAGWLLAERGAAYAFKQVGKALGQKRGATLLKIAGEKGDDAALAWLGKQRISEKSPGFKQFTKLHKQWSQGPRPSLTGGDDIGNMLDAMLASGNRDIMERATALVGRASPSELATLRQAVASNDRVVAWIDDAMSRASQGRLPSERSPGNWGFTMPGHKPPFPRQYPYETYGMNKAPWPPDPATERGPRWRSETLRIPQEAESLAKSRAEWMRRGDAREAALPGQIDAEDAALRDLWRVEGEMRASGRQRARRQQPISDGNVPADMQRGAAPASANADVEEALEGGAGAAKAEGAKLGKFGKGLAVANVGLIGLQLRDLIFGNSMDMGEAQGLPSMLQGGDIAAQAREQESLSQLLDVMEGSQQQRDNLEASLAGRGARDMLDLIMKRGGDLQGAAVGVAPPSMEEIAARLGL